MKRHVLVLILLFVPFLFIQCSDDSSNSGERGFEDLSVDEAQLVQASSEFSLNLFRTVIADESADENIFLAPLSVSYALGMTYNGAKAETREAMEEVLGFDGMTREAINQTFSSLMDMLVSLDPQVTMEIANSIWYRDGVGVYPEFVERNETYFDAVVRAMDFSRNDASDLINGWISDKTHGHINEMIDDDIDPMTLMFLINAVYFKADWRYEFDPEFTSEHNFHLNDGTTVSCDFMEQSNDLQTYSDDFCRAVSLPYGRRSYAAMLIRPQSGYDVQDCVDRLNSTYWARIREFSEEVEANVRVPKFRFSYGLSLKDALVQMGIGVAFGGAANFEDMFTELSAYISDVKHKTFVQVDEVGTEAAGVTVVEMRESVPCQPCYTFDEPFLFVVYEEISGAILFMGRISEPVWNED